MAEENGLIDSTTEARSPEQSLLDQLERIAHDRAGRFVVQLYLSRLQKPLRRNKGDCFFGLARPGLGGGLGLEPLGLWLSCDRHWGGLLLG